MPETPRWSSARAVHAPAATPAGRAARLLFPFAVALATAIAFLPCLRAGFVNMDDPENILENAHYRGLGPAHLLWMLTSFHRAHWHPLTWLTLGADYVVWGMNPFGYHLTNLLLHAANAALVYLLAAALLKRIAGTDPVLAARIPWAASLGALLFSLHPLRVESVAWVTERRDVLSSFFFLAAVLAWIRGADVEEPAAGRWRLAALLAHGLGLMSKVLVAPLPAVLLILDLYPLGRLSSEPLRWREASQRRVLLEKIPFVALSLGALVLAFRAQAVSGSLENTPGYGLAARLVIPLWAISFYLLKTFVPLGLAPLYPLPIRIDPFEPRFLAGSLATLALCVLVLVPALRRKLPAVVAAATAFVALLFPMLGVVQIGVQLAADRFTYLPSIPLALLACGLLLFATGADRSREKTEEARNPAVRGDGARGGMGARGALGGASAVLVLGVLGGLTWSQAAIWKDSDTLWQHAVRVNPTSARIRNLMGIELQRQGRLDEAGAEFEESVRLDPAFAHPRINLGNLLAQRGDYAAALARYEEAAALGDSTGTENNRGVALLRLGRPAEAVPHLEAALKLDPGLPGAWSALAAAQLDLGRANEALRAVEIGLGSGGPPSREIADRIAWTLTGAASARAAAVLEEAARRYPDDAGVRHALGLAAVRASRPEEAAARFLEAIVRDRGFALAYRNLSSVCLDASLHRHALEAARAGLAVTPADPALTRSAEIAGRALEARTGLVNAAAGGAGAGAAGLVDARIRMDLAGALVEDGPRDAAVAAVAEFLRLQPDSAQGAWLKRLAQGEAPLPVIPPSP